MGHHVHGTDAEHGPVHVVAREHRIVEMRLPFFIVKDGVLVFRFQVMSRLHKETACAASRIANMIFGTGARSSTIMRMMCRGVRN